MTTSPHHAEDVAALCIQRGCAAWCGDIIYTVMYVGTVEHSDVVVTAPLFSSVLR